MLFRSNPGGPQTDLLIELETFAKTHAGLGGPACAATMRRRPLGRTGETVSVVSLGASPLGNVFREVSLGEAVAVLEAARGLGIDLIDVAPYYGAGEAEAKLGRALAALGETSFKLATKVGRYGQEATDCDYSSARTRLSVEESLTRLGLDRIDLIFRAERAAGVGECSAQHDQCVPYLLLAHWIPFGDFELP